MDYRAAIKTMNKEDRRVTYSVVSSKMGKAKKFLERVAATKTQRITADEYVMAANIYKFHVSVKREFETLRLKGPKRFWSNATALSVPSVLQLLVKDSGKTAYRISNDIGKSPTFVDGLIKSGRSPSMDDFIAIVKACGAKVIVRGHGMVKVLDSPASKKVRRPATPSSEEAPASKEYSEFSSGLPYAPTDKHKEPGSASASTTSGCEGTPRGDDELSVATPEDAGKDSLPNPPKEGYLEISEDRTGITYDGLFGDFLEDARSLRIVDPYVMSPYQRFNLMELTMLFMQCADCSQGNPQVHLVTKRDDRNPTRQQEDFERMRSSLARHSLYFTWEYAQNIHDRHIYVDDKWDIVLGRGLDIWKSRDRKDLLSVETHLQERRLTKGFFVNYRKVSPPLA